MLERLRWHELDYRADPDRANEWRAACAARVVHRCASSSAADAVRCGERHLLKRLPRAPHPRGARGQGAVYEATGLNVAEQGAWLIDTIGTERGQLVMFDSLRSLAPAMAENDGDTVLPVTATLRCIARQTGAAVLVLHHRPKHRPGYRGSSVRRDQQSTVAADPRGGCAAQGAEEGSRIAYSASATA